MALKNVSLIRDFDYLCATGAIRPGEWLRVETAEGVVLYVADEDRDEAGDIWPGMEPYEITNEGLPCVN